MSASLSYTISVTLSSGSLVKCFTMSHKVLHKSRPGGNGSSVALQMSCKMVRPNSQKPLKAATSIKDRHGPDLKGRTAGLKLAAGKRMAWFRGANHLILHASMFLDVASKIVTNEGSAQS
eukprot:12521715-Alexandrium_andersonii.AAC.1